MGSRLGRAGPVGAVGAVGAVGPQEKVALEGCGLGACGGVDADDVSARDVEEVGVASTACMDNSLGADTMNIM